MPQRKALLLALLLASFDERAVAAERLQATKHPDVEHIDPQPKGGVSAAVIVPDSVPLVHTQQVFVPALEAGSKERVQVAVKRLETTLKKAGSSLDRIVKLNFVLTNDDRQEISRKALAQGTFGSGKPAVSFVTGKLPTGSAWAFDAVALGTRRPSWKQVEHGDGFAILPPGTRIYVSGRAVAGKNLADATRKTLEELRGTLKSLGLKEDAVVQLKAFLQPMAQHKVVASIARV
jgi:enamine deaminase RidA (YjgF/YER057c/UK114 family)